MLTFQAQIFKSRDLCSASLFVNTILWGNVLVSIMVLMCGNNNNSILNMESKHTHLGHNLKHYLQELRIEYESVTDRNMKRFECL